MLNNLFFFFLGVILVNVVVGVRYIFETYKKRIEDEKKPKFDSKQFIAKMDKFKNGIVISCKDKNAINRVMSYLDYEKKTGNVLFCEWGEIRRDLQC